ncbi:MAG: sensor histidine kinase [Vicinamibacterales bacterium]
MLNVWAQPLRRQLFIALLLMLVPMFATAAWLGLATYRERMNELAAQTQATALRAAAAIERELTGLDRMARNILSHPTVQRLDAAAVDLLRPQRLERPLLIDLVLVDREGRLIGRGGSTGEVPAEWADLVAPVLHTRTRVMSALQISASGVPYVTVSYPVRDEADTIAGVLGYYLNPQLLQDAFGQQQLPERSIVELVDTEGRVLARNLEPERYIGLAMARAGNRRSPQPLHELEGTDGVRRMYAEAPVARGPWIVSVGIPTSAAFDRALSLWTRSFTILALALGGWLLAALVVSRRLTTSVAHLEAAAQRIAAGDFSPIEQKPMPTREFAGLQNAFDQMVRRFNETRVALDAQMAEERRMRQEVESLQRQIIRQERLAAVGQLVSGVAHEINNPLQAILGFAELLQMQRNVPESVKTDLVLIQKESARACLIIRNLALFARQQTGEAEAVHLADVIKSVAELRQRRLESENIELRVEDASRRHVLAVLAELQQVVLNFVVNAEQAIVLSGRQPGRITVRTRDNGDRVILEVEDTGPGVSSEDEAKLFQPFFTTKPPGQGTGLGLSVSYGVIDSMGGHIGYRNAATGGAIFYFDLPAASA